MMKKIYSIMMLFMLISMAARAVSVNWDSSTGVLTLNYNENTGQPLSNFNNDINNNYKNSMKKIVVVGTVSTDDLTNYIRNYFDNNKTTQTLDLSGATISGQISNAQFQAAKLILPPCTSADDISTAGSKSNSQNLCYVCSLCDGTLTLIGYNYQNRNNADVISNDIEAKVYPFSEATTINASGFLTNNEQQAISDFNAANAKTTYVDGVLTLVAGDDTVEKLPDVVKELSAQDATKVVFPDGSVWEKETGKLTATADAETHKAALEAAGFMVETVTTVQAIGKYVKIVDGVTIITIPDGETGVITNNITSNQNKLSDAEKEAIKAATNLKLVGPITDDDWLGLTGGAEKVTSLDLSDAIISGADENGNGGVKLQNKWGANITNLKLPTNPNYKYLPAQFATGTNISTIDIPANIEVIGNGAFQYCTNLTTVDFAMNGNLKKINKSAFEGSTLTGPLVIPNSVETIGEMAFKNCWRITSLTINKGSNLWKDGIKAYAFFMDGGKNGNELKNVYVYEDEHLIPCDAMAFDYDNQDGQTTMATVKTRLHYPPNFYAYYVGEWKSQVNGGKVEGHDDLLALRNVVDTGSATVEGQTVTATPQMGIGWQKFVSSGIPVTADQAWRSYSDVVNVRVPDPEDKVADVYIVCDYDNGGNAILKQMVKGDIIPAGTGVIIHHYVTDTQNGGVLVFPHVTAEEEDKLSAEELKPYRYVIAGDKRATYQSDYPKYTGISTRDYTPTGESKSYHNYLEALHCMGQYRVIYNAENGNYIDYNTLEMEPYSGQKVTYRNFFFGNGKMIEASAAKERYVGVDWETSVEGQMDWGFFRSVSQLYAVNSKAFLHYPATVFTKPRGGSPNATVNNEVITGAKPMGLMILGDDDELIDVTDRIVVMPDKNNQTKDNFYTIQGVKVSSPVQRGIYIVNGKKIVVK